MDRNELIQEMRIDLALRSEFEAELRKALFEYRSRTNKLAPVEITVRFAPTRITD